VVPGYPHHVTQRGNRRQQVFFSEDDYLAYLELLRDLKKDAGVDVWAYCLMPNHVHLIAVPQRPDSLATLFGLAHRRYARRINEAREWKGHLWQERFHSVVMDEHHLMAAVRYVELNPVRAGLCARPEDWAWSSTSAYLGGHSDQLLTTGPMRSRISDWNSYLGQAVPDELLKGLRQGTRTGRPVGDQPFVLQLEQITGLRLRPRKPGPPAKKR